MLSPASIQGLDEYLRFRHVVRNVYSFVLDPARVEALVEGLGSVFGQVRIDLLAFADFLEQVSASE